MTRNTTIAALAIAVGVWWCAVGPATAQSRADENALTVDQDLNDLSNAQLQMEQGNAQVQADENAREQALRIPEQTAAVPVLRDRDDVHENLWTGEPALFDDHHDVRHDPDEVDLSSPE